MTVTDNTSGESWIYYDDFGSGVAESNDHIVPFRDLENNHHFTVDITIRLRGESNLSSLNNVTSTDWFGPDIEIKGLMDIGYIRDTYNSNVEIHDNAYTFGNGGTNTSGNPDFTKSIRAAICPKYGTIDSSADSYYMEYTLEVQVTLPDTYAKKNIIAVYKITVTPDPDA